MLTAQRAASKDIQHKFAEELLHLRKLELSTKRSMRRVSSSLWTRTNHNVKLQYVAIRILSNDDDLAYYYLCQSLRAYRGRLETDPEYNVVEIDATLRPSLTTERRASMKANPECPFHFEAAKWIAECRLFYWLVSLNAKGVAPPARDMCAQFVASWDSESRGVLADLFLTDLNLNMDKRKAWLRRFREVWLTKFMQMPARPPLCDEDIIRKVF